MNTYEIKTSSGSKFVCASSRRAAISKMFGVTEMAALSMGLMISAKKVN